MLFRSFAKIDKHSDNISQNEYHDGEIRLIIIIKNEYKHLAEISKPTLLIL